MRGVAVGAPTVVLAGGRGDDVDRATLRALSGEDDDRKDPETR